jgi:Cft2 family RNA processing exonuclease
MKIEVRQIMSIILHGASCHLLIMGDVYVLLDCGISPSFDFSVYQEEK